MATIKLSAPWRIYYHQVKALFAEDPEVTVLYDEEACEVKLYVQEQMKAEALSQLLPSEKRYGHVTLKVFVIPANQCYNSEKSLVEAAFAGNGALAFVKEVTGIFHMTFFVFKPKVVQYYTDNLGDYYGMCSTLYQDLAKEVLGEHPDVYYCTDLVNSRQPSLPLGEWP